MSVLPKGLISREQMKGVKGVETIRNTLLPTTNAPFSPSGNNRVIFNVPAITNSFLTQRSYFIASATWLCRYVCFSNEC